MMTISRLEVIDVRIPFNFTFKHALAERSRGHSLLVRATDDAGHEGYGECVPRSYVTGETPESVRHALRTSLARPFLGVKFRSFSELASALGDVSAELPRDRHAAFCSLELALLDLAGRAFDCSAGDVVGPLQGDQVTYSGVVSADDPETSEKVLEQIKAQGFSAVKLKVGMGLDVDEALLKRARSTLGPHCALRIDANGAWTAEDALRHLERFAPLGLQTVEQPVAGDDISGLEWLAPRSPTPIVVDESLASLADASELIARRACHHFNIRISKCGGLINSVRLRDLALASGLGFQLGAQVGETVLLSAAGRHFAARSARILFSEGSFGNILLEEDIGQEDLTLGVGGVAPVLQGPGLGILVDSERLERYVTAVTDLGGD